MPIYESEKVSREKLTELRKRNRCKVCGGSLSVFFDQESRKALLACMDYLRTQHEGIEREASRYEQEGLAALNIESRREIMVQEHGKEKALVLRRFDAVATLDKKSATDILKVMWPKAEKASPAEFMKALGLCVDYGLDPRLGELFMLPFKVKVKDEAGKIIGEKTLFETVRGIKATRKVALRKHKYSYIDDTPRYMTEEEEKKAFKVVDGDKIRFITVLKDMETGAEFRGYGQWPKYRTWVNPKTGEIKKFTNEPKGIDKGNSMENMAAIRSERAALERGYPADMPSNRIPVVDEQFIEGEYHEVPDGGLLNETEESESSSEEAEGETGQQEQPKGATSKIRPKSEWDKVTKEDVPNYPKLETVFHNLTDKQPREMYVELGGGNRNDMSVTSWDAFLTLKERFAPEKPDAEPA